LRVSSRSHYPNKFPLVLETAGQPGHCPSTRTFGLR
jgi:hypothetical protein